MDCMECASLQKRTSHLWSAPYCNKTFDGYEKSQVWALQVLIFNLLTNIVNFDLLVCFRTQKHTGWTKKNGDLKNNCFHSISLLFLLHYWALLGPTRPYWALLGPTGPYWALLGLTRPYWALLGLYLRTNWLTNERTLRLIGLLSQPKIAYSYPKQRV